MLEFFLWHNIDSVLISAPVLHVSQVPIVKSVFSFQLLFLLCKPKVVCSAKQIFTISVVDADSEIMCMFTGIGILTRKFSKCLAIVKKVYLDHFYTCLNPVV